MKRLLESNSTFLLPIAAATLLIAPFNSSGVETNTFSNPNPIIINDSTNPPTVATPYPSTIVVTGLTGLGVTKVTVELKNLNHTYPDDVVIVLVGPQGQNTVVMSNVGGGDPGATNLTVTLDDDAPTSLPFAGPLVSGTFKPTKRLPTFYFTFPPPAPPIPGPASLAVFKNVDPNGTWSLYAVDDSSADAGSIMDGWSLNISSGVQLHIVRSEGNVILSWPAAASGYTLQATHNLMPSVTWTNMETMPPIISGKFTVTDSIAGEDTFYRLTK